MRLGQLTCVTRNLSSLIGKFAELHYSFTDIRELYRIHMLIVKSLTLNMVMNWPIGISLLWFIRYADATQVTELKSDRYRRWETGKTNRITAITYHMSCCCRETGIKQVGSKSKVHFLDWPESVDPCCKLSDWLSSALWLSNCHLSLPYSSTFVFPPWRQFSLLQEFGNENIHCLS